VDRLETDVCIVGAGVAGAIVARACVDAGRTVMMFEAGRRVNARAPLLRLFETLVRDYRMARMKSFRFARHRSSDFASVGNREYDLSGKCLIIRGGSTLGWGGDAYRLQPEDFHLRSATGRGRDWPLSYDDLEPYYERAEATLRVRGEHTDQGHPPRRSPFPLPPQGFPRRDRQFLDLLGSRGWPAMHHPLALAPDGGAFTADGLLDELERHPSFTLATGKVAMRILGSTPSRATALELVDAEDGQVSTVDAQTIIVCAGGIETPNLLRRSEGTWAGGLGNHSGHLGRNLVSHTGLAFGGRPRGLRWFDGPIPPTASTRHFDSPAEQAEGKFLLLWRPAPSGYLFLNTNLEQVSNETSSVTMGAKRNRFGIPVPIVQLDHTAHDREREQSNAAFLDELADDMGLTIAMRRHFVLAHPMCTARMSTDPADGVVDPQLRVHGTDNVFVCGSAVFPTGGAANPTLTIAALAHRLGDFLAGTA
jgi:choline dehydrogenase-like flavoprotein